MRRGQVHVYPLALFLQAGGVPVPLGTGNWGTLASSEPHHSASASLNQAKNTQPTHGPLFTEDQFVAALKQALTPVHARRDTIIFHSLFKFDQCYEAMAIQQQYAQQAIIKCLSHSPTNSYDYYWYHYYHTNSHCCVHSAINAHPMGINGPRNQYWLVLSWFHEWHLP